VILNRQWLYNASRRCRRINMARGQSKSFLLKLRKKYKIGEFKRATTGKKSGKKRGARRARRATVSKSGTYGNSTSLFNTNFGL
jgi:hypothetical protein